MNKNDINNSFFNRKIRNKIDEFNNLKIIFVSPETYKISPIMRMVMNNEILNH